MWKGSVGLGLPYKEISLVAAKADERGKIRLQIVQRGTRAI